MNYAFRKIGFYTLCVVTIGCKSTPEYKSQIDAITPSDTQTSEFKVPSTNDGLYQYQDARIECEISIVESTWYGKTVFHSGTSFESYDNQNAIYDNGVVKDDKLYDQSGYIQTGIIRGGMLITTIGGREIRLAKMKSD